jgi:hypothetical protein
MGRTIELHLLGRLFTKFYVLGRSRVCRGDPHPKTVPELTERHFLRKVAPSTKKSKHQRRCAVYSQQRKKKTSMYCCQIYDVILSRRFL